MLTLRAPLPIDLPPLFNLLQDQADKFLDDFHEVTLDYVEDILNDPNTHIVDDHGYAAGAVWFEDTVDDLHTTIHVLVRPEYWRRMVKDDILPQAATIAFKTMGIGKILAFPMHTQKSAVRVLRKYKFYEHKPWHKHTRQKGVKVDVIMFELRRKFWETRDGNWK